MKPYFSSNGTEIYHGDCRDVLPLLPSESAHCVVTSPPYWGLRDYGVGGQIGLESTPYEYISTMREVFAEVRRVLRSDGTLWLNMGDSYASEWPCSRRNAIGNGSLENGKREARPARLGGDLKPKDLCGIPWMLAFALREDGWYLRQDIIWAKPNPMPESVTDRCTKSHEYIFLLSKSERYYYDHEALKEVALEGFDLGILRSVKAADGQGPTDRASINKRLDSGVDIRGGNPTGMRNKRSVWEVTTQPFPEAHFATFPEDLIKPCILAGCPEGGTVLDPFGGAGTTALVARKLHSKAILCELNAEYIDISAKRLSQEVFDFSDSTMSKPTEGRLPIPSELTTGDGL